MGFFDIFKKKSAEKPVKPVVKAPSVPVEKEDSSTSGIKKLCCSVAGTSYRREAIESIGKMNPDYKKTPKKLSAEGKEGETIFEYLFPSCIPAELIPEPDNEYDSNAVKVVASGTHIGYIKRGSCSRVKNIIKGNEIVSTTVKIGNGNSFWFSDGEKEKEKADYSARVTILYSEKT